MKNRALRISAVLFLVISITISAHAQQCLVVRSAEGHRFRNAMVAGVLTGGIGLALGGAFGGGKYEYVDGMNFPAPKLKYNGGELQKLQQQGVHIVVINKKAQSDETKAARESCKDFIQQAQQAAAATRTTVPVQSTPTQEIVGQHDATPTTTPVHGVNFEPTSVPQQESLGDAARRAREQKEQTNKNQ